MLGIIIQARTGSTRLPNKMLLPFFEEKGILELLITKLKSCNIELPIIVATSTNQNDDVIEKLCQNNRINVFRGNENNVIKRFIDTAEKYNITKIIRICADNPLLNIQELKKLIEEVNNNNSDYTSFLTPDDKPTILTHFGLWAEGVKLSALKKVLEFTTEPFYYEHVTNYIYTNPTQFAIKYIPLENDFSMFEGVRLTLDTKEDFELLQEIYAIYHNFNRGALELVTDIHKNGKWLKNMKRQIELHRK